MSDSETAVNINPEAPRSNRSGTGANGRGNSNNAAPDNHPAATQSDSEELETRHRTVVEQKRLIEQSLEESRRQNQLLLEQAFGLQQKMDSSGAYEKERAEFISAVAHELRTPLTSIKGYIDLVLEGEAGEINELQREFLSIVGANADKLSRIIGDLLDVSRLEAGRMTFKPVMVDLRTLVSQTCESIRPQVEAKGIQFETDLSFDKVGPVVLEVSADPERFSQALRSVLANAVQLTPQGGKVRLRLYADDSGEKAVVTIEDEGPGIQTQDIPKVFSKFWHPDDPGWREGGGPGLGLAISKTIVDMHEGSLEVDNRAGGGSIFTIKMPLVNRLRIGERSGWAEPEQVNPERSVLVISRDPAFGRLVQHMLKEANFQVIIAGEQGEVVSDSPAWQPDLIVENGAERDMAEEQATPYAIRAAPVLTVHFSEVERRLLQADALGVLPWPCPEQNLVENLLIAMGSEMSQAELTNLKQNKAVLLVSNNTNSLRNLDRALHEAGYAKVYRATQESDALTLARRYQPALLVVDVYGGEDEERGPAFFEMLREDPLLRDTPALALTLPANIKEAPTPKYHTSTHPALLGSTNKTNYYNVVPKPFLQRRFINVARRLTGGT